MENEAPLNQVRDNQEHIKHNGLHGIESDIPSEVGIKTAMKLIVKKTKNPSPPTKREALEDLLNGREERLDKGSGENWVMTYFTIECRRRMGRSSRGRRDDLFGSGPSAVSLLLIEFFDEAIVVMKMMVVVVGLLLLGP